MNIFKRIRANYLRKEINGGIEYDVCLGRISGEEALIKLKIYREELKTLKDETKRN